jgi:cyclopropane fatty-acyl-phospholipid synthase-like methyltransferase
MTEFELLVDFHLNAERQGPGSDAESLKALQYIPDYGRTGLKILDIGCGTGAQTLALARNTLAEITAVDLFDAFLHKLNERAEAAGYADRIHTVKASMDDLPFEDDAFDIIWSEGAIYNMGFKRGLKYWKRFLKPGGHIALSEITWCTNERPAELQQYWDEAYPEINTGSAKLEILEKEGFKPLGYFVLKESSWTDNYYTPSIQRFDAFLHKHGKSEASKALIDQEQEEIQLYEKYKSYFSYGFYIAEKLGS